MDIQLKRGLLDVCVLAAIKNEDSYGYKIIKDMKPYIELSESTLYTILKRLEAASMLTVRTVEHDGRLRKYYHITAAGLKRIEEFKDDWNEILSIYRFVTKGEAHHELNRISACIGGTALRSAVGGDFRPLGLLQRDDRRPHGRWSERRGVRCRTGHYG